MTLLVKLTLTFVDETSWYAPVYPSILHGWPWYLSEHMCLHLGFSMQVAFDTVLSYIITNLYWLLVEPTVLGCVWYLVVVPQTVMKSWHMPVAYVAGPATHALFSAVCEYATVWQTVTILC